MSDARGKTTKNSTIKKNFFIFSSQNKKLEIHRKVQLLFIISMIFFLQQSRASKVQTPFSREANVNPSGSTHVYFNVVFYRIARAGPNVSYDNSTALCLSNTATERSTQKLHLFSGALRRKRTNRLAETKYLQLGSDEGLTLETTVFKTLYGGRFAL